MKPIQSKDNPRFKQWLKIASGKVSGQLLLEGIHLCQEWLRHQGQPQCALFDVAKHSASSEMLQLANDVDADLQFGLDHQLWSRLSSVAGEGQGVSFIVSAPKPVLPDRLSENCLWLDRVQDPGNLGTLLRTAAAVGIRQVFVGRGSAGVWSSKVLRSAQGAHFALQIFEDLDLSELCGRLDVPLAVTTLEGGQPLFDVQLPRACAWLAGNEGQGVDRVLQEAAQLRLFIPQAPSVESLNVGVAMAVCLYEQVRQHRLLNGE